MLKSRFEEFYYFFAAKLVLLTAALLLQNRFCVQIPPKKKFMKNLISSFIILAIVCFNSSASAQQTFDVKKMDALFDVLESNERMMGTVTLTENGKTIYRRALGYRNVSGKEKNDFETKFRIGSITKVFTAVMIYQLIEEKKLTLETKLSAFFPQIPNADKITIAQMLSHRTGLPNYPQGVDYNDPKAWVFSPQNSVQMLERFAALKPNSAPGEKYQYSNMNYTLLGFIVESLTKSNYGEQLNKRIARKIGLKRTHYGGKIDSAKNEARGFFYDEGKWNLNYEQDPSVAGGSGGIVSTTHDLTKFVAALFGGKLLKPASLREMTTSPADRLRQNGKGIGNFEVLDTKKRGHSHDGGFDVFRSLLIYVPEEQLAFAVTINGHNYPMNRIFRNVLSIYYGKSFEMPSFTGVKLSPETLSQYEGTFSAKGIGLTMTIKAGKENLIAQTVGQDPFPLEAVGETTFNHQPSGILIEFQKNADGKISSFTLFQQVYEFRLSKEIADK